MQPQMDTHRGLRYSIASAPLAGLLALPATSPMLASFANTGGWKTPVVLDDCGDEPAGLFVDLAMVKGAAVIRYTSSDHNLSLIRAIDVGSKKWGDPVTDTSGEYITWKTYPAVNKDKFATAFFHYPEGDSKYVHPLDENGTDWRKKLKHDSESWVGKYASMTVMDGMPDAGYDDEDQPYQRATNMNETNSDLKFIQVSDENGHL